MNIAIDITQIMYQGTGVGRYTEELVRHLTEIDEDNTYILFAYTLGKKKIFEEFYSSLKRKERVRLRVFPFPEKMANFLWNWLHSISLETLLGDVDIYHSSDWIQIPSKAKKITTIHDLIIYKYPETSHPYIIATHKKRLQWVKKECQAIIVDSQATKDDLIDILKIDRQKIEVIYPGIEESFKPADEKEVEYISKKYYLDKKYILSVGTLEPRKNLKNVIAAFHLFRKKIPEEVELVLIGSAGWNTSLRSEDHIRVVGYVPEEDLPGIYSGGTIYVNASLYEGFGLPILEAMACGCPVVCSDRGSLKEISLGSSIHINPENVDDIADKLFTLYDNKKLRDQLIQKSLVHSKKFQWDEMVKKVLQIYKGLSHI